MIARAVKTFEATVTSGRLEHETLRQLEGARVRVQVTVEPAEAESSGAESDSEAQDEGEPEPPEWLDVEDDVYVPMRGHIERLEDVNIVDKGKAQPTIIVPEEDLFEDLPDE